MTIEENLSVVEGNIASIAKRCDRDPAEIKLIAVSKTRSLDEVMRIHGAGQNDFGENTIQDAMSKIPLTGSDDIEWHFIGHLQSKKAKQLAGNFSWLHTIDSVRLAQKVSSAMQDRAPQDTLKCLIQVNVSGEESKSGVIYSELLSVYEQLCELELPNIEWRGLMTIGLRDDPIGTREVFRSLSDALHQCRDFSGQERFDQLSMGMSDDYEIAIEEGATMLRLGTTIFGEREYHRE